MLEIKEIKLLSIGGDALCRRYCRWNIMPNAFPPCGEKQKCLLYDKQKDPLWFEVNK